MASSSQGYIGADPFGHLRWCQKTWQFIHYTMNSIFTESNFPIKNFVHDRNSVHDENKSNNDKKSSCIAEIDFIVIKLPCDTRFLGATVFIPLESIEEPFDSPFLVLKASWCWKYLWEQGSFIGDMNCTQPPIRQQIFRTGSCLPLDIFKCSHCELLIFQSIQVIFWREPLNWVSWWMHQKIPWLNLPRLHYEIISV